MCHCHTFPKDFSPKLIPGLSTTTRSRTTVLMDGAQAERRPRDPGGSWAGDPPLRRSASGAHAARAFMSEWERKAFAFLTDAERQGDADAVEFVSPLVRVALLDEEPSDVQLCSGGKAWPQGSAALISRTLGEEMYLKGFFCSVNEIFENKLF